MGTRRVVGLLVGAIVLIARVLSAADLGEVPQYHVLEVQFAGPEQGPTDTPARDVELTVAFRHEAGEPTVCVVGFWDGDGQGANRGGVFCARFCPPRPGQWMIAETKSNRPELSGQRVGDWLRCTPSPHPGFWLPDGRWYKRSNGSHSFIVGNTHYSFLSRQRKDGVAPTDPMADIRANSTHFRKLRFTPFGDRYPDPALKPFLDDKGQQTEDGAFALRPNPAWFHQRVDPAVREGFTQDLICDLILCGPDTRESRSALQGDPAPWLRYAAARYGSFPNVWFCLANEWNIKNPKYTAAQLRKAGGTLGAALPHPTPISVHAVTGDWDRALNTTTLEKA